MTRLWQYVCASYFTLYASDWNAYQSERSWRYTQQWPRRPDLLYPLAGWLISRGYLHGDPGAVPWAWEWRWDGARERNALVAQLAALYE